MLPLMSLSCRPYMPSGSVSLFCCKHESKKLLYVYFQGFVLNTYYKNQINLIFGTVKYFQFFLYFSHYLLLIWESQRVTSSKICLSWCWQEEKRCMTTICSHIVRWVLSCTENILRVFNQNVRKCASFEQVSYIYTVVKQIVLATFEHILNTNSFFC